MTFNVHLQSDVWEPLPYLIYGTLGTVSGLLTFLLPETHGQKLPQTIQDAINLGKRYCSCNIHNSLTPEQFSMPTNVYQY